MAFSASFVFRNWSYWMFVWRLVSLQRLIISAFGEDFKVFLMMVWHCSNLKQACSTYGPRAKSGPRTGLSRPARWFEVKISRKFSMKETAVLNITFDATMRLLMPKNTKNCKDSLNTFYRHLLSGYPNLTALAAKVLCMFGNTYVCEQAFSVMNINKTKFRLRLMYKHLNDTWKLAATQAECIF